MDSLKAKGSWNIGRIPWNKGKKMSEETKEKNRASHPLGKRSNTGRTHFKKGSIPWTHSVAGTGKLIPWNKGKKLPQFSGVNHPRWKGGTKRYSKTYTSFEYKQWRSLIFERDKFLCQSCGCNGLMNAHHIKPFAKFPDERFSVDNGITLCGDCHREIHKIERFNHSYALA